MYLYILILALSFMSIICRKHILLSILALVVNAGVGMAQRFNQHGYPMVTHFAPTEFDLPEQVWCVTQDSRGVIYFGTADNGILEYDGSHWRKIATPSRVSTMLATPNGDIYVGLDGNFGHLRPTANGSLEYASLTHLLPDSLASNIAGILSLIQHGDDVLFCSRHYIYTLKSDSSMTTSLLPPNSFITSLCGNDLLVGNYKDGLLLLQNGKAITTKSSGTFFHKNIYRAVKRTANHYWVFTNAGVFDYDRNTQQAQPAFDPQGIIAQTMALDGIPYFPTDVGNGNIGVGYIYSDWINYAEFDSTGQLCELLSPNANIGGSNITSLLQKGHEPLWLAFADGIPSKVHLHSPIRMFGYQHGLDGYITGITHHQGTLYVCTDKGLFRQTSDTNGFAQFEQLLNNDIWAILDFKTPQGNQLIVTTMEGLYTLRNGKLELIQTILGKVKNEFYGMSLLQSKLNPQRLYLGTSSNIYYADMQPNGMFREFEKCIPNTNNSPGEVYRLSEDHLGNIWAFTSNKRLIMLNPKTLEVTSFTNDSTLVGQTKPFAHNDSLFVLTHNGIMHFDYTTSTFKPGGLVGNHLKGYMVDRVIPNGKGYIVLSGTPDLNQFWVNYIAPDSLGHWQSNRTPFKALPNKAMGFAHIDNNMLWVSVQRQLFCYNPNKAYTYANQPYNALIRRITFKDSVLFNGSYASPTHPLGITSQQSSDNIPTISYANNTLEAQFSATYFDHEEATQYAHYLEGSNERTWSRWDNRTVVNYTNLSEGRYTLHVKARNIYGVESSEATYSFKILPPWYRTIVAYIFYVAIVALLLWRIIKWYTKRLVAENERLEKIVSERTAEVVAQKEEIETQREKLLEQNREITSSIQYASRIQQTMLSPEETVNAVFPDNFILYLPRDIVSGDFYVITQVGNKKISVVADCTGHGVPGGFMSMLGMSSIAEIINKNANNLQSDVLLNQLREKIIRSMHQTGDVGTSKDGMDLALYILDETEMTLDYAGANNPLVLIRDGEVIHLKPDKMPIGVYIKGNLPFNSQKMEVRKGDCLYTFSDGYADQFGGHDKRKFMSKNLRALLLEIHQKPMAEQRDILERTLSDWHGLNPRIDDVVVMGVRI